jgi:hypothetical protein
MRMRRLVVGGSAVVVAAGLAVATAATLDGQPYVVSRPVVVPTVPTGGWTYPPARGPACAAELETGEPSAAAGEIQDLGWSREGPYHRSYAGLTMSGLGVAVYRVRNDGLDREIRRIAAAYGVCVDILDARLSRWNMLRLSAEVTGRQAKLAAIGADLNSISHDAEGHLTVGVSGDVEGARKVLHDLADHVDVTFESPGEPL